MGLDVSHDCFSGSYGAFNRFRGIICQVTGGHWCDEVSGRDSFIFQDKKYPGLWVLLNHSDCDGKITPADAAKIADDLEKLLPAFDLLGSEAGGGHIARDGGYAQVARHWIEGCRLAAKNNEPVVFM